MTLDLKNMKQDTYMAKVWQVLGLWTLDIKPTRIYYMPTACRSKGPVLWVPHKKCRTRGCPVREPMSLKHPHKDPQWGCSLHPHQAAIHSRLHSYERDVPRVLRATISGLPASIGLAGFLFFFVRAFLLGGLWSLGASSSVAVRLLK